MLCDFNSSFEPVIRIRFQIEEFLTQSESIYISRLLERINLRGKIGRPSNPLGWKGRDMRIGTYIPTIYFLASFRINFISNKLNAVKT